MSSQPVSAEQIKDEYAISVEEFATYQIATRAMFRAVYACDVLHVQEVPRGSNSGPDVDRYLASAGAAPGDPWCGAFGTSNLLDSGAKRSDLPQLAASVHAWLDWAIAKGNHSQTPERSMFGLIIESATSGHLVQITAVDSVGKTVATVEGNSNDDGSSEGYEVVRHRRSWSEFHTFLDLSVLG